MSLTIGIPRELFAGEKRVASVPDVVEKLIKLGFAVRVETGAGAAANFSDEVYQSAGATIAGSAAELWAGSQDELAIALDAVAAQVDPGASAALRQRWQGKRVRWSVTRVPALCGPTEPCHVQPFASARRTETSARCWP